MQKINKPLLVVMIVVFLSGLLLIEYSTRQNQIETRYLEEEYSTKLAEIETEVEDKLAHFNFTAEDFSVKLEQEWIKQEGKLHTYYPNNYYKLEVSPFGPKASFLSDKKEALVTSFADFDLFKKSWEETQQKVTLSIELGMKTEQGDFKLYTLEFVQNKPVAKMAIIIDDFGLNWSGLDEILSIPRPFTAAVLPGETASLRQAEAVVKRGHEILLHQPLEAQNELLDPGPGAIHTTMTEEEITDILLQNIESLPGIKGVNNHMGSKATEDKEVMEAIMKALKEADLYFIDSNVTSDSIAEKTAQEVGVKTARNYYFIDNVDDKDVIKNNLLNLAQVALDKEELIVIGHVKENTALAIKEAIPKLEAKGISLVYASKLIK